MTPVSLTVFLASLYCNGQLPCTIEPYNTEKSGDHAWYVDIEEYEPGHTAMIFCEMKMDVFEYVCEGINFQD